MKQLVQFPLEDGQAILVEVDEPGGFRQISKESEGRVYAAKSSFEEAISKIRPALYALISSFKELPIRPAEIDISFGLKMSSEAGLVVSAGDQSNFEVKLKWTPEELL